MSSNRECPVCKNNGHDSDNNHLFLMSDGKRWMCNRVEYHDDGKPYYEDVGGEDFMSFLKNTTPPPVPTDDPDVPIRDYTSGTAESVRNEYRCIDPDVYTKYGVRGVYAPDGELKELRHDVLAVDGKVLAEKVRKLPKDFFCTAKTGKGTEVQLFGQSVFKRAKRLLITEGELDAMSAYQMLQKWKVACVSLPLGANIKALLDNREYLSGFKEIYVCTDMDDKGQAVSRDIANLIPTAKFVKISGKDANEMLIDRKESEFISAFWDAKIYTPDTIVRVSDVLGKVLTVPTIGTPWPWPSLTDATYGRNGGQGIYVGAGRFCQRV